MTVLQTVSAFDIKPGDLVVEYGGIFRVVSTHRYPSASANGGEVQANICEFFGDAVDGQRCSVPIPWRKGWNVQGSISRAVTRRVSA